MKSSQRGHRHWGGGEGWGLEKGNMAPGNIDSFIGVLFARGWLAYQMKES